MRRPSPWIALLPAVVVWAGCASSQMNRIDSNRDLYESWPLEMRQAVLDGKVEPGMTPDMVEVAWGKPSEVVPQGGNGDEIWVYKRGGDDGTMLMGGPSYPAGYPSGVYPGTYPGGYPGGYPGVMGGGRGIVIGTGRGGTVVGTTMGTGIGLGAGGVMGSTGLGTPVMVGRPTPPEIREVVFRNGVVQRADAP